MEHGTPQQVRDEVKGLIDLFGPGGLILDSSSGLSDGARPENVAALIETARTYGHC
jgi:uroporphyrinogen-III decarboxylase